MIGSIDPGKHACAMAVGDDARITKVHYGDPFWLDVWLSFQNVDQIYVEIPQVYPGAQKGDPNDLIQVSFSAGIALGGFRGIITQIRPREWKGTIRKEVMLKRIEDRLTSAEIDLINSLRLPKSKRHNVVDACGILLWRWGRL